MDFNASQNDRRIIIFVLGVGAGGALIGWVYQAIWAIPMGIFGAGTMTWYLLAMFAGSRRV